MKQSINILSFIVSAAVCLLSWSCSKDGDTPSPVPSGEVRFGLSVDSLSTPATRSLLTGSDIEDRRTCVTLAAYEQGGHLATAKHFTSSLSSMSLELTDGVTYDIYALVNMGDMTSSLPSLSSDVEDMEYEVPSYSDVNSRGIPMAGSLVYKAGSSGSTVVPVRRLFAKVTAVLSLGYDGASITGVRMNNLNGSLRLFGGSAASSSSDIMTDVESATGNGVYVMYVPENMQGDIGSASSSLDKNPDRYTAIAGKSDLLTYIEVDVKMDGTGDYGGSVTYRSYIGSNATRNFDIEGNCRYVWTVTYLENNLQYDHWKIDTGSLDDLRSLYFITDPIYAEAGEVVEYGDVISTSMDWDGISHTFSESKSGTLSTKGTTSLTVSGSAADGATVAWNIKPKNNPAGISDDATIRVVSRYISLDKDVYGVDPGKSAKASVSYGDTGRGRILGKGGSLWNYETASALSLSYTASSTDDILTCSVPSTVRPGDYPLSVATSDGKYSDEAVIRVNDTRYIDLLSGGTPSGTASSGGDRLDASAAVGHFDGSTAWTFSYGFGDCTGAGKLYGKTVSSPSSALSLDYDEDIFSLQSFTGSAVTLVPKAGLAGGSYPVRMSWLEDGACPVTAYLNISGELVQSIALSVPSVIIYTGESTTLSATVSPADATVKALEWEIVSGGSYATVNSSTGKVTGVKAGTAKVVAKATDGSGVVSSQGTVEVRQHVTDVNLNTHALDMALGETATLTAEVLPADAYDKSLTWTSSNSSVATVDQNGKVIPKGVGSCVIRATSNDVNTIYDECTVTVDKPAVTDVTIGNSPGTNAKLMKSDMDSYLDLDATATLADGSTVTSGLSWNSSNTSVATVDQNGKVTPVSNGTAVITVSYTSRGVTKSDTQNVQVSKMTISPASQSVEVGGNVTYTLTINKHDGSEQSGPQYCVDWTTDETYAKSNGYGKYTGVSSTAGVQVRATVKAGTYATTLGEGYVNAVLVVNDKVEYRKRIEVTSPADRVQNGKTLQMGVLLYEDRYVNGALVEQDASGTAIANSLVTWSISSGKYYGSISTDGLLTATAVGSMTVKAALNEDTSVSATKSIESYNVVTYELEVTPETASITVGQSFAFTAKFYTVTNGVRNSGTTRTTSSTWSSSNTSVATVSSGSATGVKGGTATITASFVYNGQTYTDSAVLTVTDVVTYELDVTPSPAAVNVGGTVQMKAILYTITNGVKDAGQEKTASSSWSIYYNASKASVNSSGLVTGLASGTATVKASFVAPDGNTYNDTATVNVSDVVTYEYEVTPEDVTVDWNETAALTANFYTVTNGVRDAGTAVNTSSTWSSSSTATATVTSSGVVKGVKGGTTTVTATYTSGGVTYTDNVKVTVNDVVTYELEVTPETETVEAGSKVYLAARFYTVTNGVRNSGLLVTSLSTTTWSTSASGVATVSKGTVTGVKGGAATITASYTSGGSTYTDSAVITVNPKVTYKYRIEIVGGSQLAVGSTMTYSVKKYTDTYTDGVKTATDGTGETIANSLVTWSISSGTSYASVSAAGVVTGNAKGTAVVKAVLNVDTTVSDTISLTVTANSGVGPDPGWDDDEDIEL